MPALRRRACHVVALTVLLVLMTGACVGSGKIARANQLGPLPAGLSIVYDTSMGCREGESGFDYRFLVIGPVQDLSQNSTLLRSLRQNGFYWSRGLDDDLPWISVAYQNSTYPLRAELGMLDDYLADPVRYSGPDPAQLPADVRASAENHVLVAMRPTDFACSTPL